MNVYDFDETIYDGDSTRDFVFYAMRYRPKVLLSLPKQGFYGILFLLKMMDKTVFKEKFYSFFKHIDDMDEFVDEFVESHMNAIKPWYLAQHEENDVIISASPEFLLKGFCERLNIKYLIASKVDPKTGKYDGLNCYHSEKVVRFRQQFKIEDITAFYSDSYSDSPMAEISPKAYLVKGDLISKW